jgi:penicillin-binding protein A
MDERRSHRTLPPAASGGSGGRLRRPGGAAGQEREVNAQISRVAVAALVLLSALIVGTTYWQAWAASGLADRRDNSIQRVAEFEIDRGRILASDRRTVLARNIRKRVGDKTLYFRRYPTGGLFAHAVGYSTQLRSRTGLERSQNDFLTAANANLNTVLDRTLDRLRGKTIKGNDVVLTLNPRAQRVAMGALAGNCGAVAAIEPATGRVLVLASRPTYNPNLVEQRGGFARITRKRGGCQSPLLNRATSGLYPPGSIFKVVTGSAALESGKFTPESRFNDPGYCIEYGRRVQNYDTTRPYGGVNLYQGLQYSINSVFCEIGKKLGGIEILDQSRRFGFYSDPPLDTPPDERSPSGLYKDGKLYFPEDNFKVDPGRLAFGQERMLVTPIQMAMVAGTVANGGIVMRPTLVQRVQARDGQRVSRIRPSELGRAISATTARELTAMMGSVVSSGTGTAAQISGVSVAGKTGTAETGVSGRNVTWFIAFAPAERPRVAIAVVLENQSGTGGTTAAPIAKQVMEALLPSSRT